MYRSRSCNGIRNIIPLKIHVFFLLFENEILKNETFLFIQIFWALASVSGLSQETQRPDQSARLVPPATRLKTETRRRRREV